MTNKYTSVRVDLTVSWEDLHNYVKEMYSPGVVISTESYADLVQEFFCRMEEEAIATLNETHPYRLPGITQTGIKVGEGCWKIRATSKVYEEDPELSTPEEKRKEAILELKKHRSKIDQIIGIMEG